MLFRKTFHVVAFFTFLTLSGSGAFAAEDFFTNEELFFEESELLDSEDLDELRGGFITSNGITIDFTFSANTLVDGELISQSVLSTIDTSLNSSDLNSIIQIGNDNRAFDGRVDMSSLPNILTVLQNSQDNITLQQINLLDLNVQNVQNYIRQSIRPDVEFQSSFSLSQ
jgi:hypothetical protein